MGKDAQRGEGVVTDALLGRNKNTVKQWRGTVREVFKERRERWNGMVGDALLERGKKNLRRAGKKLYKMD